MRSLSRNLRLRCWRVGRARTAGFARQFVRVWELMRFARQFLGVRRRASNILVGQGYENWSQRVRHSAQLLANTRIHTNSQSWRATFEELEFSSQLAELANIRV